MQPLSHARERCRTACGVSSPTLKANLSAGLTAALVAIPDGIASAMLAGLDPIHGLYALMMGTPIAAMLASTPVPPI